jgi:transcriptional regulator with XRE-family HTH domain
LHLFAREHVDVDKPRQDWPIGPALRRARERAGISAREAARRTNGAISSGRWYQLESGWQKNKGTLIAIGTTAATIAAAAKAVDWDQREALDIAGFNDIEVTEESPPASLDGATDDELLAEIRKRMEARYGVEATQEQDAPGETVESEKSGLDEAQDAARDLTAGLLRNKPLQVNRQRK